jgi:hypothetical protein
VDDGDGVGEVGEVLVLCPDFGLVDEGCRGDPGVVDAGFAACGEGAGGQFGVGGVRSFVDRECACEGAHLAERAESLCARVGVGGDEHAEFEFRDGDDGDGDPVGQLPLERFGAVRVARLLKSGRLWAYSPVRLSVRARGGSLAQPGYELQEAVAPPRPEQVVFSVGATAYRRRHLVEAARAWGDWDALLREAREELACAGRAAESGDPLEPPATAAAGASFRRAHGLLAAEDLEAWLAERDVSVADWLAYVRQELLRDEWRDELSAIVADSSPAEESALVRTAWTLGICSGATAELAERLAAEAAADATFSQTEERGLGEISYVEADVSLASLKRLRAAHERLVAEAVTSARVDRELEAHRLPWTSVDCVLLVHPDLDVVREAALCVTQDRLELAAVAREAGAELRRARLVLGELPPVVGTRLFAAEPGELLDPVEVEDTAWLVLVEAKTMPSAADPELRNRAAELIAARERARVVDRWIRWHERL